MDEPVRIMRFSDDAMMALAELAQEAPELWQDPETDFPDILGSRGIRECDEDAELTASGAIVMQPPAPGEPIQRTDRHALDFHGNIPGLEARHMADPNLLAWLSSIHMLEYGILRWPLRGQQDLTRWAIQHFLSSDARDMSNSNVAGRPLWLAETARRASRASGSHTPQQVLNHYASNTGSYHIQNEYEILRAPRVMGTYIKIILEEALGASEKGIREIARGLNRAGGARLLDVVSLGTLREIAEQSADQVMRDPDLVSDRNRLRGREDLQVLSFGAGAQTTVLALMAEKGYEGLEKPNCGIFADTGWEPRAVYENLEWVRSQVSFPIYKVDAGSRIQDDILEGRTPTGRDFIGIPVHTRNEDGREGIGKRQCTREYKLEPIRKKIRELLEIPNGQRAGKTQHARVWIGITTDEAERKKPSRDEFITNWHPFLEMDFSRAQLIQWFQRNYPEQELPRSACIGCPFRTDVEWKHLRDTDPGAFEEAAHVDWALRNIPKLRDNSRVEMYLSNHLIPLHELDLENTPAQAEAHRQECEGLCWI